MRTKFNLVTMHDLSLADLHETITFDGYNINEWIHVLGDNIKRDNKFYIPKGYIPKQTSITGRIKHNALWKHCCDAEDVSKIILGKVITGLRKEFKNLNAFYMFHQVEKIFLKYSDIWNKPVQKQEECKAEESHHVCSK